MSANANKYSGSTRLIRQVDWAEQAQPRDARLTNRLRRTHIIDGCRLTKCGFRRDREWKIRHRFFFDNIDVELIEFRCVSGLSNHSTLLLFAHSYLMLCYLINDQWPPAHPCSLLKYHAAFFGLGSKVYSMHAAFGTHLYFSSMNERLLKFHYTLKN